MNLRVVLVAVAGLALSSSLEAGDVWVTRDSRGRLVLTNRGAQAGSRQLRGKVSVASSPGGQASVPVASASGGGREINPEKRARYVDHVAAAATRYMLSPRLIEAVIAVESDFRPDAVSKKGAQGLMQLMPDTARDLAVDDAFDPGANIHGGARYLRELLDQFNQNLTLALAAYNAGPTAVRNAGGVPRIPETQDYVRKVRSYLGHSTLSNATTSLVARRDASGRLVVTNLPPSAPGVRMSRDSSGVATLSNR